MHQNLFVFDIETIPDTEAVFNLTGNNEKDHDKLREALDSYHLEITDGKNAFPRQPFHKVVAISFLEAEIHRDASGKEEFVLKELRSGGKASSDEKELLEGFFSYVGKMKPRLVSFNGRSFDLPVLKYRAMKYGIQAAWLYKSGDKWNSYSSRYSDDWHCDLLEVLSDFGASTRCKLHEVCAILGFPGKFGADGGSVMQLYDQGKLQDIRDYCETDVLNTYMVYLRYMLHNGTITKDSYNKSIGEILSFIRNNEEKKHLQDFFEAWNLAASGKLLV